MPRFPSHDGTVLAYRTTGTGPPLVCVPGGPGRAGSYLGDLGGLSDLRTLVVLDNRGTGHSDQPADPATYRRDRLADAVAGLTAWNAGDGSVAHRLAAAPLFYGHWDTAAQAHAATE